MAHRGTPCPFSLGIMSSASGPTTVRVITEDTTIVGTTDGTTDRFRSVPYATPIVSVADRFAPVTPIAGRGPSMVDATSHPHHPTPHSLSITTPAGASARCGAGLPVVVFVHGGRYEEGDANEAWYRGTSFARSGCVYVSVNYRMGFDGFLPLDDEDQPSGYDPAREPGYFRGAEDIAEALRWVRSHITRFGGDPTNVTAMGQSAGAALVCWLLTSPRTSELIQRAVVLSCGFPRRGWQERRATAARVLGLRSLAQRVDRAPVAITRADVAGLSHDQVDRAYRRFSRIYPHDCAVGPYPFRADTMATVPMLVGSMRDEFVNMVPAPAFDRLAGSRSRVVSGIGWALGYATARWVELPVAASRKKKQLWKRYVRQAGAPRPMGRAIGDGVIRRWVNEVAEAHARRARTWMYEFHNDTADRHLVAQHCGDLPLVFDALAVTDERVRRFCGPDAQRRLQPLADEFHRIVVDFAHGRRPKWPEFRADDERRAMMFDMGAVSEDGGSVGEVGSDPLRVVRAIMESS